MGSDGSNKKQITDYVYDTQILNPHYSPDGTSIVFAMADIGIFVSAMADIGIFVSVVADISIFFLLVIKFN